MILSRRTFLKNTAALIAAPGIVKASSIMSVRPVKREFDSLIDLPTGIYIGAYAERDHLPDNDLYGQLISAGDWAHVVYDRNILMFNGKKWQSVYKL